MSNEKREILAAKQHEIWSHWMKYLFSCTYINDEGGAEIPAEKVERWTRQMNTGYADLTEAEKQSDRHQVMESLESWSIDDSLALCDHLDDIAIRDMFSETMP